MIDLRTDFELWVIHNTLESCKRKEMPWVTEESIRTSILVRSEARPAEYEIDSIQASWVGFQAGHNLKAKK